MANRTISDAGGNWNATGSWVEAAVPTADDDVVATATSGNLTINVAAVCRLIDLAGYVGTLTHNAGIALDIGNALAGGLTFVPGMTYTLGSATTSAINFVSTTGINVILSGGKTFGNITFNGVGGTWRFDEAATIGATATLTLTNGTLDAGNQNVTLGLFSSSNANTRTLTMGSGTWDLTGTNEDVWNCAVITGLTLNANTSTIKISDAGALNRKFVGGGLTYNDFTISSSGAGIVIISGSNTFATFTINAPKSVRFTNGTTQTITTFVAVGVSGSVITIDSALAGTAATLSKASGTVSCDYLSLKDSAATGGATWLAGSNSTNVSGNSGWSFTSDGAENIARSACVAMP